MKKIVIFSLAILMLFSLGTIAGAKVLKVGLDAGRFPRIPRSNYPGGCYSIHTGLSIPSSATHKIWSLNPAWPSAGNA